MPDRALATLGGYARSLLAGLLVFLGLVPGVAVVHQTCFLLAAGLVGGVATVAERSLLPSLPLDPVYAGAGLRVLGGIQPVGLALAGPAGWALHGLLPAVFGPPSLVAPGALVSALLVPGATVSARAITMLLATIVVLFAVTESTRRSGRASLLFATRMVQVWLLLSLTRETAFDVRELEATGLPFALAALAPVDAHGQRPLLTSQLDTLPEPAVEIACALLAMLLCLAAVAGLRSLVGLAWAIMQRRRLAWAWGDWRASAPGLGAAARASLPRLAGLTFLVSVVVLTPIEAAGTGRAAVFATNEAPAGDAAAAEPPAVEAPVAEAAPTDSPAAAPAGPTAEPPTAAPLDPTATWQAPSDAGAAPAAAPASTPPSAGSADAPAQPVVASAASPAPVARGRRLGGSVVTVSGGNYRYTFAVDGISTVVRGMGYNPWYAKLAPEERRRLYDRDFSAMREIGVNTLEGWFQDQFDEVTLDAAHEHGLGVILPFELNHDYDYGDPAVRARFRAEITAWVLRYKDHPALLMWGPGNEVMHRLIFPTAVQGTRDPAREQRADDFAAFYVELVDLIHELDPDHPVVYRDAEDLYFARIRQALLKDGVRRSWFVYGTNVYTQRLAEVIRDWPAQGLDAPLLVSEFSPGGVGPAERPRMLGWYWSTIRAHPERVIGGVVYTWATRGPEDLDRVFGLTDENGRPVDGSLAALRRLFHEEEVSRRSPR